MDAADELVPLIYACLLGEAHWADFIRRLAVLADVECTTLFFHDSQCGKGAVTLQSGIPDEAQREYLSHYGALNPWMWQVGRTPVGTAIVGEQLVARDKFHRTEYYNDFLRRFDQETGVGVTIERTESRFMLLSTLSGDVDEERNAARARLLSRLAPHLRRASEFYRRNQLSGIGADLTDWLSETGGAGFALVDPVGRASHISILAEKYLSDGQAAYLAPNATLRFRNPGIQSALQQMQLGPRDVLPITHQDNGFHITLMPVGQNEGNLAFCGQTVAVVFTPALVRTAPQVLEFARRFGLTPAETRVLTAILDGQRPAEIAAAASLSVETVRSQLKSVFSKTGSNGQPQLIRMATGLAGLDPL
ncbi:helix-turn-helix transcriptional regulator [Pseudogemmobacter faecipullorum]|uniref:Helix-turn-helix transcriptional regulator n=1 Tax=Pseudogemmobacter faecipullorum TaxID=2755041 RepID=A0ABS8CKN9_9RHOB|nr:helix-turn-helix transcriptional regulator [Pseudogemmobacter faecipullorum]MCB5409952.1 helix-turn-helix transcriptional regulator [Pseudogemmobacter faecipullorum]